MNRPTLLFTRKFFRHVTRMAAIAPSSRTLALATCRYVDSTQPQTILELGAGTGAITSVALERMHPHSTLLAVEVDGDFVPILEARCPGAQIIQADAGDIFPQLRQRNIKQVDVVLSGLPIPVLPRHVNQSIFACLRQVAAESPFSQITEFPWLFYRMYRRLFLQVDYAMVWRNLPPGGVYHCHRLRPDYKKSIPGKRD